MLPGITMAALKGSARTGAANMTEAVARAATFKRNLLDIHIFPSLIGNRFLCFEHARGTSSSAVVPIRTPIIILNIGDRHAQARQ